MFLKAIFIACLLLAVDSSSAAQRCPKSIVDAKRGALMSVPGQYQKSLVDRLNCYVQYLQTRDINNLYDFATIRKRKGLSREEFVKSAQVSSEGEIIFLKIQRVVMADNDDYVDEPKPAPGEGDKWFVSTCAKIRIEGKVKKYEMGFDLWLTDGQWYVNRGGLRLVDGGHQECKS